jgi:hypothetical protein
VNAETFALDDEHAPAGKARIVAIVEPPGPAPATITSQSFVIEGSRAGR